MTTTLNATTSNGLVVTPDNSGNVLLQYNGVAAPAFFAYMNSSSFAYVAGFTRIIYDSVVFDTNSNYSTSTGRFTPTVAGYYQFNWCAFPNSGSQQRINVALEKNLVEYARPLDFTAPAIYSSGGSTLAYANGTTDFFTVSIYASTSGGNLLGGSTAYTAFSACLLRGA
jgi:hypothetical protein